MEFNQTSSKGKYIIYFLVITLLLCVVASIFLYYYYETPLTNDFPEYKFFITFKDIDTKETISTDFVLIHDDSIIYTGKTTSSIEEVKVYGNYSTNQFRIMNFGNNYYTTNYHILSAGTKELELHKIGNVSAKFDFGLNNEYKNITLTSNLYYRDLGYCVRWSKNILEVNDLKSPLLILDNCNDNSCSLGSSTPLRLKLKVDKCWYPQEYIDKNINYTIEFEIKNINSIDENDYLELYVFDSDRSLLNKQIIEDVNGKDVGGSDYKFVIK